MSTLQASGTETATPAPGSVDAAPADAGTIVTEAPARPRRARSMSAAPVPWVRVSLVAALGVLIAGFLWLIPYDRSLEASAGDSRTLVDASCPVPLNAAFAGSTDATLNADGEWAAGSPPCARTARYRVGLGVFVLLAAAGGAAAMTSRARARTSMVG